jgi:CheY-like chemotaxis protein
VWAESAGTGQGCTFVVELPLADADPSSGTGSGLGSGFGHGGESVRLPQVRVLYVEDEADVAAAMQAGLRRLGAEVSTAASHAEAVAQLAQGRFDVVVTDLNLGEGGTGHDVARALHAMPGQSNVPVIAVSAFGTPQDVDTTRSAGFRDHLVKPVDAVAVARAILNALRA